MHWYVSEDREGERRRGKIGAGDKRGKGREEGKGGSYTLNLFFRPSAIAVCMMCEQGPSRGGLCY